MIIHLSQNLKKFVCYYKTIDWNKGNACILNQFLKACFLGDDYINKPFTGDHLKIKIHYLNRDHGWSTTKFKKLIAKTV